MSTRLIKLTEENIKFLRDNYFNFPAEFFAKKFNTTKGYIQSRASILGITKTKPKPNYKEIISDYLNYTSYKDLEKKFHITRKSIQAILKTHNIAIRNKSVAHQKFAINQDYFQKIDTSNKAYMLGFIYADGNVYKTHLKIDINMKDEFILHNFLRDMNSTHRIYSYRDNRQMTIVNERVINDLNLLGVYPRKTYNMEFPTSSQVPNEFLPHFLRGFFDGDGSIQYHKYKSPIWRLTFMAPESFSRRLMDIFQEKCGVSLNILQDKRIRVDMKTTYASSTIGLKGVKPLQSVYDFLYPSDDCEFYLPRKKDIFENIFRDSVDMNIYVEPRKCMFNGMLYDSITQAARANGIPYSTMRYKCVFI